VSGARRAAFLDRDGVLNERAAPHDYVRSVEAFRWLPGAAEAVASLRSAGFTPVVVSNQRGIARGLLSWETLHAIEERIQADLAERGARIEAFYYCPHDLDAGCDCRKPGPGMLLAAARDLELELGQSVLVGDEKTDIEAGRRAGCFTILVGGGEASTSADAQAADLASAVADVVLPGLR
jgi:D-glycero-D-manno-heptose 1,7-bisphosphate phosphatase